MSLLDVADRMLLTISDALQACEETIEFEGRYLGPPHDITCCDPGRVYVWWENVAADPGSPCGLSRARLNVEWRICWPVPELNASGEPKQNFEAEQATTQRIWQAAECGWCALTTAVCEKQFADSCRGVTLGEMRPITPQGGCAGVRWSLQAVVACNL